MTNPCDTTGSECLREEVATFERERAALVRDHEGKFALVKGADVIGIYENQQEAYSEGLGRFGNHPFLIRQITKEEPTQTIPALFLGLINAHA